MRRRDLLAGLLAAAAGCSGTPSPTATPSPSATATPRPGSAPAERRLAGTAEAADGTAVTARRWFALSAVRYRTDDGHDTVEPVRDRFVAYDFTIANRSDGRLRALPDGRFRLRVAGTSYEHVHALRGSVPFSRVDQPADEPEIRPLGWYDWLGPGESVDLQLVFDAADAPDHRHYLAWDHTTEIEGREPPVYLFPRS